MPIILGLDPGFGKCGYCLFEVDKQEEDDTVLELGVIKTSKSSKKRKLLVADDNLDRAGKISKKLWKLSREVAAICAESMSFPRNSSTAAKMAMCWGIISAVAVRRDIPVLQATPQEIKLKICGVKTASKQEIQDKLNGTYKECEDLAKNIAKGQREHPYDSLAAVIACLDSSYLKLLRKSTNA
jgi:Holliday junction resolvasome RuvABC endonuclease subunit